MDGPSLRVSDADREQTVILLREHLLAGRLTLEEFSERIEAALNAGVRRELAAVQEDLPAVSSAVARSGRKPTRLTPAVLGHVLRRRPLTLPPRTLAPPPFPPPSLHLPQAPLSKP